jgi:hypothetical protein
MDTCLDGLERAQAEFHKAFNNRMEDVEGDTQALKIEVKHIE